jgi:hypothetical protein
MALQSHINGIGAFGGSMGETVTSEKIFGRLGPPQKQPRKLKFLPRCGRTGKGTIRMRTMTEEEEKQEEVVLFNKDMLMIYGLDRDQVGIVQFSIVQYKLFSISNISKVTV